MQTRRAMTGRRLAKIKDLTPGELTAGPMTTVI